MKTSDSFKSEVQTIPLTAEQIITGFKLAKNIPPEHFDADIKIILKYLGFET